MMLCVLALGGCGWLPSSDCGAPAPEPIPDADSLSAISRAVRYLQQMQLQADQYVINQVDFAGDWPQCFTPNRRDHFVRDASPFMATFIHHALGPINETNRQALRLLPEDIEAARQMRAGALDLMSRFRSPATCPDSGTYGFWPHQPDHRLPHDELLASFLDSLLPGPDLMGQRAPVNLLVFPDNLAIPSDADDTALIYAAMENQARFDGGAMPAEPFHQFFADWRDVGTVPRRNNPDWLPANTGAYLTWLAYHDDPAHPNVNDVDVAVNANVLFSLGRFGRLDTPGADDAIHLINLLIANGVHRTSPNMISIYYPDNLFLHYAVARAGRQGGVADLQPAALLLMQDLLDTVQRDEAGRAFWDRGDPALNTALAAMTLMMLNETGDVVDGAVEYLRATQDIETGAWEAGFFFRGRFDNGIGFGWTSASFTTAMALEALVMYELGNPDGF